MQRAGNHGRGTTDTPTTSCKQHFGLPLMEAQPPILSLQQSCTDGAALCEAHVNDVPWQCAAMGALNRLAPCDVWEVVANACILATVLAAVTNKTVRCITDEIGWRSCKPTVYPLQRSPWLQTWLTTTQYARGKRSWSIWTLVPSLAPGLNACSASMERPNESLGVLSCWSAFHRKAKCTHRCE